MSHATIGADKTQYEMISCRVHVNVMMATPVQYLFPGLSQIRNGNFLSLEVTGDSVPVPLTRTRGSRDDTRVELESAFLEFQHKKSG